MIKYRPNRSTLEEAMANAKEFDNLDKMYDYIIADWNESGGKRQDMFA